VSGDPRPPRVSGAVLFARYAYPPNALGYCGPGDPAALLEMAALAGDERDLARKARMFEGAWPYLELVARCNGIDDPLDRRVVEAYWTGNELTRAVPAAALAASLEARFASRAGRRFAPLVEAALAGGVPQHSFHVFAVYPWLGLLRAGREEPALEVLERCRIRWGRVHAVNGDLVSVRSRPLDFAGSRLVLGAERLEVARRSLEGVGFAGDLAEGDVVSLHWDWVCDRLSARSLAWLKAGTCQNLRAVNALAAPGPAAALGA
jgi:hypothetical protein